MLPLLLASFVLGVPLIDGFSLLSHSERERTEGVPFIFLHLLDEVVITMETRPGALHLLVHFNTVQSSFQVIRQASILLWGVGEGRG